MIKLPHELNHITSSLHQTPARGKYFMIHKDKLFGNGLLMRSFIGGIVYFQILI